MGNSKSARRQIATAEYDLICIVPEENRGWILEKLANVVTASYPGKAKVVYSLYQLQPSRNYLFLHYDWLLKSLRVNPILVNANVFALYTHPKEISASDREFIWVFTHRARLICGCKMFADELVSRGIDKRRVTSLIGAGADPKIFKDKPRKGNCIGLVAAYYPRKNPDLLLALVRSLPEYDFLLLGSGWRDYHGFNDLEQLTNFSYAEDTFNNYPIYYSKMNVFLSLSTMEGGPVPLVEAMMANLMPVVTNTGFANEVIKQAQTGYLFPISSKPEEIKQLIHAAFKNDRNVHDSVKHLTWDFYAEQMALRLNTQSFG